MRNDKRKPGRYSFGTADGNRSSQGASDCAENNGNCCIYATGATGPWTAAGCRLLFLERGAMIIGLMI